MKIDWKRKRFGMLILNNFKSGAELITLGISFGAESGYVSKVVEVRSRIYNLFIDVQLYLRSCVDSCIDSGYHVKTNQSNVGTMI